MPPAWPGLGATVSEGAGMWPQLAVRLSLESGLPVEWGAVGLFYW